MGLGNKKSPVGNSTNLSGLKMWRKRMSKTLIFVSRLIRANYKEYMNKTIELSKEQIIGGRSYMVIDDLKSFSSRVYLTLREMIYWADKGIRILFIVTVINLAAVGVFTVYSAYKQHMEGKSIGYVIEGAQMANTAAPVAYDESSIEADLAAANKRLRKGAKYVD